MKNYYKIGAFSNLRQFQSFWKREEQKAKREYAKSKRYKFAWNWKNTPERKEFQRRKNISFTAYKKSFLDRLKNELTDLFDLRIPSTVPSNYRILGRVGASLIFSNFDKIMDEIERVSFANEYYIFIRFEDENGNIVDDSFISSIDAENELLYYYQYANSEADDFYYFAESLRAGNRDREFMYIYIKEYRKK